MRLDEVDSWTFMHHAPCPKCGSSDALAVYEEGHKWCFSCSHYIKPDGTFPESKKGSKKSRRIEPMEIDTASGIKGRALTAATCQKFRYGYGFHDGQRVHIATYYDGSGRPVAYKTRDKAKNFAWIGDSKAATLFGQNLWKAGGKKLVITEGEIDAMSMSQAQDNRWPVVSVPNGASGAARSIKKNLEFVNSFETVVFMFDSDEPGREAVEECVRLLSPGKAKVAKLPLKDASKMLLAGRTKELVSAMWNAKDWRPEGIVSISELKDTIFKEPEFGLCYPWPSLTQMTYGMRPRELVVLGAGTGTGKSTKFKQIMHHLAVEHDQTVGGLFLEEGVADTAKELMSIYAKKPFHLPDTEYTEEEFEEAYQRIAKDDRIHLYNHYGSDDWNTIESKMRYMAVGLGCKFLFLDHITMMSYGEENERKELDRIMKGLKRLKEELDLNIHLVTHLTRPKDGKPHEEGGRVTMGQLRGSHSISQCASFVMGLERDQQKPKSPTTVRILKDRFSGRSTGKLFGLAYDYDTGILNETTLTEAGDHGFQNETDY